MHVSTASPPTDRPSCLSQANGEGANAHRHDTCAIGSTIRGVQSFRYRREQQYCLPGQRHILHPDEVHDGKAATDLGFAYRIAYIDPSLIQRALGGQALPFARVPVVGISRLPEEIINRLMNIDEKFDELSSAEFIVAVADFLGEACISEATRARHSIHSRRAERGLLAQRQWQRAGRSCPDAAAHVESGAPAASPRSSLHLVPGAFRFMRGCGAPAKRLVRSDSRMSQDFEANVRSSSKQ
ncbi:AraC family ligand binding domain-containing protein [Burkholderia sp. IMCC1007]|uniref:AraC family ligand binding domain-containing protein n=1 Tax=Burkholderia sp. IMCC1007 TaxID=3004104 RepID=UPI0022B41F6D|nr:AraC family ligand binding domain-containing protein [Burkholderia sp. IMCC1007]